MTTLRPVSLLERLRANKGISLLRAAELMHMSHKTLRKYEREVVAYPQGDVLRRCADLYGVTPEEILEDLRARARAEESEREAA